MKNCKIYSNSIKILIIKTVKRIVLFFYAYIFWNFEIKSLSLCDFKR